MFMAASDACAANNEIVPYQMMHDKYTTHNCYTAPNYTVTPLNKLFIYVNVPLWLGW